MGVTDWQILPDRGGGGERRGAWLKGTYEGMICSCVVFEVKRQ